MAIIQLTAQKHDHVMLQEPVALIAKWLVAYDCKQLACTSDTDAAT